MRGMIMIPIIGYEYTVYMDYMDSNVRRQKKAVKPHHSLTSYRMQYHDAIWAFGRLESPATHRFVQ